MPRRPFTLRDAMLLIAATAIGLGAARGCHDPFWSRSNRTVEIGSFDAIALEVSRWILVALPMAWAWTVALLVIGLQGPRAGLRPRISLPGSAACGAATIALVIDATNLLAILTAVALQEGIVWDQDIAAFLYDGMIELSIPGIGSPGIAVTVAWVTLAVTGRWQPEPSWIDRAGRLMGLGWIGLMMLRPWVVAILLDVWT
jgi:hypothetical protein